MRSADRSHDLADPRPDKRYAALFGKNFPDWRGGFLNQKGLVIVIPRMVGKPSMFSFLR